MQPLIINLISILEERNRKRKDKHLPPEILTTGKLIEILKSL